MAAQKTKSHHGHVEFTIPHGEISDPQTITEVNERKFAERGLRTDVHEVDRLEDDHDRGVRHMRVRAPRTYFFMGGGKNRAR